MASILFLASGQLERYMFSLNLPCDFMNLDEFNWIECWNWTHTYI